MSAVAIALLSGVTVAVLSFAIRPPEDLWARWWARLFGRPRPFEAVKEREARRQSRRRARFQVRDRSRGSASARRR